MVRVGVIGLGFMGATHVAAVNAARAEGFASGLVAVCDRKASRRRGELWDVGGNAVSDVSQRKLAFDADKVRAYESADALLGDTAIDLVCICTPTPSHIELATAALRAGKHVLVEKPVSLRADEIRRLDAVAREMKKICMPAMCMRFWPAWKWLKDRIDFEGMGDCLSATFTRLGSMPRWAGFFADGAKSGGALVDLHIHDADFVLWCFGKPEKVFSAGRIGPSGAIDHVTSVYTYAKPQAPRHVVAEGGWDQHEGFAFRMRYVAIFEKGTVDFDLSREPQLLFCRDRRAEAVHLQNVTGYDLQLRHIVGAIQRGETRTEPTLEEAATVIELLDAERESIARGEPVILS